MEALFAMLFFLGFMVLRGEATQDDQRAMEAVQAAARSAPERRERRRRAYVDHHAR